MAHHRILLLKRSNIFIIKNCNSHAIDSNITHNVISLILNNNNKIARNVNISEIINNIKFNTLFILYFIPPSNVLLRKIPIWK